MFSPKNHEEKPYNTCLDCIHIGKKCDGPNFLAMSTERWSEWVRLRKEYLGWTNAQVAERAEVSKVSVDRIMSGNIKDIRTTTMQSVTKALVNGTWGKYPCALAAIDDESHMDKAAIIQERDRLQDELVKEKESAQKKIDFLKQQILFKESQMKEKDELLRERYLFMKRKDVAVMALSIALGVVLLAIIAVLLVDLTNGHFGFFRN